MVLASQVIHELLLNERLRLSPAELFAVARLYRFYCILYVSIQQAQFNQLKSALDTLTQWAEICRKLKETGLGDLLDAMRNEEIVPLYRKWESDIQERVGAHAILGCTENLRDAFEIYGKLCALLKLQKEQEEAAATKRELLEDIRFLKEKLEE